MQKDIQERKFKFALRIIELSNALPETRPVERWATR
jgi:hypothetical protein